MAISYHTEIKDDILFVSAKGNDENLDIVSEYAGAVINSALEHNCSKIICDERELVYELSVIDTYSLAVNASESATSVTKVAIVCSKKSISDGKFYETVASNRGLTVRVMTDYDAALAWLMEN